MRTEDIKVAINGNQVSLTAEIKEEKSAEDGASGAGGSGTLRSERYYGQVHPNFTLPQEVDDDHASACYETVC